MLKFLLDFNILDRFSYPYEKYFLGIFLFIFTFYKDLKSYCKNSNAEYPFQIYAGIGPLGKAQPSLFVYTGKRVIPSRNYSEIKNEQQLSEEENFQTPVKGAIYAKNRHYYVKSEMKKYSDNNILRKSHIGYTSIKKRTSMLNIEKSPQNVHKSFYKSPMPILREFENSPSRQNSRNYTNSTSKDLIVHKYNTNNLLRYMQKSSQNRFKQMSENKSELKKQNSSFINHEYSSSKLSNKSPIKALSSLYINYMKKSEKTKRRQLSLPPQSDSFLRKKSPVKSEKKLELYEIKPEGPLFLSENPKDLPILARQIKFETQNLLKNDPNNTRFYISACKKWIIIEKDGTIYKGDISQENKHGLGISIFPDNRIFKGTYKNNEISGSGIYKTNFGFSISGQFDHELNIISSEAKIYVFFIWRLIFSV